VNVVCVDPGKDPLWRQMTDVRPGSVFNSPAWTRVLAHTYGLDVHASLIVDNTGQPRAGVPFCRILDVMGERIVSLPFSDYCDPLVSDTTDWQSLAQQLVGYGCPVSIRCLHNQLPIRDDRFRLIKQARWHSIDVRPDLDALWRRIDDSSKRAIHKAERFGVVVRVAQTVDELRAFHDMHVKLRKYKYGLLAQPFTFFAAIWQQFVENGRGALLLAIKDDRIVAGVMLLDWAGTVFYKFNASIPHELAVRPNDLLIWESIKYAKARSASSVDLGLSDWDQDGLVRFKRKFATEEKAISWLQYSPESVQLERQTLARDVFRELASTFSSPDVSDDVSRTAGELLYRYLA
jgi:CelD/BcsL family acetyltransferase involved in cellulose biosynthesis